MLSQAISLLAAVVVMQGEAAAPAKTETIKLHRIYKTGDVDTYDMAATFSEDSGLKASATVGLKILATLKEGGAEAELSCPKFAMESGGSDTGTSAPANVKAKLNRNGMPAEMEVKDEKWVYVLFCVSGYVPAAEVEKGKEFDIAWSGRGASLSGTGRVLEIKDEGGRKLAVVRYKVTITPDNDDHGDIDVTSTIDLETGKLAKADGTVKVGDDMTAGFSVRKSTKGEK